MADWYGNVSVWGQHSFWLNALAPENIPPMLFTAAVFQLPIAWLNALAP
jgi:hypothetical protein